MIRQPKGTLSYTVSTRDSLDSIALHYNTTPSELMRLNRLGCRMIFPGQMLYVPDPDSVEPVCVSPSQSPEEITPINENFTSISGSFDKPRDVPVVSQRQKSKDIPFTKDESSKDKRKDKKDLLLKRHSTPKPGKVVRQSSRQLSIESPVETEYFEKFLKINVKYITDGQGVVSGVLLVTPNAIMFDPNVSDPLVIENGADMYGIITPMEMVISAAMYHDISPMLRKDATAEIYHAANCPLARKKKKKEDKKEDTSENKENIDDKISMNMQQSSPEDGETQCDANTEEDKDEVFFQAPEKLCDCVSENKCKDESDHIQPGSKSQITTKDTASDEVEKLCRTVAIDSGDGNVETRESTDTKLPGTAKIPDKLVTASASLVMGDASVESGSVSVSETLENCEAKGVKRVDIEIQEEALVAVADKQQIVKLQDQCDIGEYVDDSVNKGSVESGIAEMNETMTTDEMSDIVVESGRINTHATVFNADNSKPEDKAKMVSHRSSNDVKQAETDSVVDGKEGVSELPSTDPVPVDSGSESATQHPLASNTSNVKGVEDGRFGEFKTLELSPDGDVCEQKAEIEGTTCDLSLLSDVSKDSITEIQSGVCSDTSRDDDDDDAIRPRTRSFVDFSSGLFAKEQDPSSMVPDITEVIRDTSATQMEIERIKASARRVRITPRNRKKSDSDLQQDRKERTKKQLERLASWDTNYHAKSLYRELLLRPKRMNEPPLYLCLKVGQPMKKTFTESSAIESYSIKTKKPEYWFAVPKDRADHLYAFFVQWSPNIYGKEDPDAKEMVIGCLLARLAAFMVGNKVFSRREGEAVDSVLVLSTHNK
ncbi:nuclear receptor coactivator 7-like [Saccoglossus kowalevskii]